MSEQTFGAWLQETCDSKGITRYQLAKDSGAKQSQLSHVVSGQREATDELIEKIAPILGVDVDETKARRDAASTEFRLRIARLRRWFPAALENKDEPSVGADLRDKSRPLSRSAWAVPAKVKPTEEEKALMRQLEPADLLELGPAYVEEFWSRKPADRMATLRQWIEDNAEAAGSTSSIERA